MKMTLEKLNGFMEDVASHIEKCTTYSANLFSEMKYPDRKYNSSEVHHIWDVVEVKDLLYGIEVDLCFELCDHIIIFTPNNESKRYESHYHLFYEEYNKSQMLTMLTLKVDEVIRYEITKFQTKKEEV